MKKAATGNVYQFKIILRHISPPIWRRILMPEDATFWDLHVAIQSAFGWGNGHLHCFDKRNAAGTEWKRIEVPHEESNASHYYVTYSERDEKIADWFSPQLHSMCYTYDFGDEWIHEIKLEKIVPRDKRVAYPACIAGKRACPPEDCGGPWGYQELLEAVLDPKHERYEELKEWLGEGFDPDSFDLREVAFDDPDEIWTMYTSW
jgi:hypothetical protein